MTEEARPAAPTFNATLMGVSFTPADAKAYLDECPLGTEFYLKRDPFNEWDMNAIEVKPISDDPFVGLMKLGMIDRETASKLAWFLDHDYHFHVELASKDPGKARKHSLLITPINA